MSEPLAEARVVILPDLSLFGASLKAQLAAQIKEVEGATAAVSAKAAVTTVAAKSESQLAAQQLKGAATSKALAASQKEVANVFGAVVTAAELERKALADLERQQLKTVALQEQLARGAGATGLSLLGVRGATLAAGGAFLAGAASITILAKAVSGAIDDQESLFRVTRILGTELGEGSKKWAESLANSFGLADDAALKFEGAIAQTLHNVGLNADQNAKLSKSFVELAADLAAFAHVPVEQTLRGLQLALSGNTRALRQYGVVIQNTEVQNEALRETGKKSTDELTRQEITLARVALIQDRLSNVTGSFAARQGTLAAQSQILKANIQDLGDTIGATLLPALVTVTTQITDAVKGFKFLIGVVKDLAPATERGDGSATALGQALHFVGQGAKVAAVAMYTGPIGAAAVLTQHFLQGSDAAKTFGAGLNQISFARLMGDIPLVTNMLGNLSNAFDQAAARFRQGLFLEITIATRRVNIGETALLRAQAEGAPLSTQLGIAQKRLDAAAAAVAVADKAAGITGGATKQKQALQAELKARQDVDSIQGQIDAAANKGGGGGGGPKGPTAQEIADKQDQALLTAQQLAQGQVNILKARKQQTKSLVDDVVALQAEATLTRKQIVEASKIHDANTRLQTIQQLTLSLIQTQADIEDKQAEILQRRRQRLLDAADARVQLASLDAQIAEVRGAKAAQIRALQRENVALEAERRLWRGNTVKQKEITLEIARNNAAIRDLRKEKDKSKDGLASLAFTLLQNQQGFAANVLSNLLPASAVAGTVGGTSGAISTATVPFGDSGNVARRGRGDFSNIGGDVSKSAQISAGARGASAGQMSTLIGIQRAQLAALQGWKGRTDHPEAARAWAYSATEMLNTGW